MIYADEKFYTDSYLLGRKPVISAGFLYYARQASQIIDQYTFGRLGKLPEIPEAVKMCCCELAEAECRRERRQKDAGGKTSEKIGTYSVTYESSGETSLEASRDQRNIVMKWLANTGLCYQGVG